MSPDISAYNEALAEDAGGIVEALRKLFDEALPGSHSKLWHGHPVWFLGSNPIVGYSLKKAGVQVLFWSGNSFHHPGLTKIGKFQAAGVLIKSEAEIANQPLQSWLQEAVEVQWDYANLPRLRSLKKLTKF